MPDQIQRTRLFIDQVFTELNASQDEDDFCETVLIRDGHYCGHRFTRGDFMAVWFFEEHEIKFYDGDRQVVRVESVGEPLVSERRAA